MPQVQFVNNPGIGSALGDFGAGFLDQYTQASKRAQEEDALQNLLGSMSQGASEEDVLKQVFGAKGVPFEKKQSLATIFSQSKLRAAAQEKTKNQEEYKKKIEEYKLGQKDRELDIKEQGISLKPAPVSDRQKTLNKELAKEEVAIIKEIPKLDSALRVADEVSDLIEETTGFGSFNLNKQAKLQVAATSLLEPIIKIYNPSGQLSTNKLEYINDKFNIGGFETRATQRGKIAGVKNLLREQRKRLEERKQLINEYGGSVPLEVLQNFDQESEEIYDELTGYNKEKGIIKAKPADKNQNKNSLPAPKRIQDALKGVSTTKPVRGDDGKIYYWTGEQWVSYE